MVKLGSLIGQERVKQALATCIQASRYQGKKTIPHTLLSGQSGLGKTTIAQAIAEELEAPMKIILGQTIDSPDRLSRYVTRLQPDSVLFIDEIHSLRPKCQEVLYSIMQDSMAILTGMRIKVAPFTLVGATTRPDALLTPLRNRFTLDLVLDDYTHSELVAISQYLLYNASANMEQEISQYLLSGDSFTSIALAGRGSPRQIKHIVDMIVQILHSSKTTDLTPDIVHKALDVLHITPAGLTRNDLTYLRCLNNQTLGLKTISAVSGLNVETVEAIEPYLIKIGYVIRGKSGRYLSESGKEFMNGPSRA